MDTITEESSGNTAQPAAAGRFLSLLTFSILLVALMVATINLFAYRYMLREDNQAIVQLMSGWGRIYKPILYDELQPQIAIFGASWARDAFDPIETGNLLQQTVFNHAVSGGTAYETRRFGDAALDNRNLQAIIINLDTFYRHKPGARFRYGFDESVLDVDPDLNVNKWVEISRAYSLALGGWAVGANLKLMQAILARDQGVPKSQYLESYQHMDWTRRNLEGVKKRLFPEPDQVTRLSSTGSISTDQIVDPVELELMIDRFCANEIEIYTYFTPTHSSQKTCDPSAVKEISTLQFLRRKQTSCKAQLRYFDFSHPNMVTLEGVLKSVGSSEFYRPDRHPRSSVGLLMAARMFERDFPHTSSKKLENDFGVELLAHSNAEGWLTEHAARCQGDWGDDEYMRYYQSLVIGSKSE